MRNTKQGLNYLLAEMKNGKPIIAIDKYNRGVGFIYYSKGFLFHRYYGQSAVRATADNLNFILETIFQDCYTWDFCRYSEYHVNYIPTSSRFIAVDLSTRHPNSYGL